MSRCKKHNIIYDKKNCPECKKEWDRNYYKNNKNKANASHKAYVENNKEEVAAYKSQYYAEHKEEKKEYDRVYRKTHVDRIRNYSNEWHSNKYETDVFFRLSKVVSANIRNVLFNNNSGKNGISCFTKLDYSIQQLKEHLEKRFESWMSWNNYGKYDVKVWDDNDPATWTWQIDHIIPQSDLPYTSMDDENFKKCWALENLRPYSSKLNLLDGTNRIRHLK